MAFRKRAIENLNLDELFHNSRKAYWFESVLAYRALKNGFNVYRIRDRDMSPLVWHIENKPSVTRSKSFNDEFWIHYDRTKTYHRLKILGARTSFPAYVLACLASLRKKPLPRLFATIYAQIF